MMAAPCWSAATCQHVVVCVSVRALPAPWCRESGFGKEAGHAQPGLEMKRGQRPGRGPGHAVMVVAHCQIAPGWTDVLMGPLVPGPPVSSTPPCNSEALLGTRKWFHA